MKNNDLFEHRNGQPPEIEGKIYSVGEITSEIKHILMRNFGMTPFWVKGEISNFKGRNSQGHIYFKLKDEKAVLNVAFFSYANRKMRFDLEEGMQVLAMGRISLYEPQGSYQLIAEEIRPAGLGDLHLKFEQLKKKLMSEGLFDEERKRTIPKLPEKIGIISSPTGAAVRDMIKIIRNRMPSSETIIFPVRVQGDEAKYDIEEAIELANRKDFDLDLIILGRGGGSTEELWAFNEENVARAIFKSRLPIISAVGHETDFTISDFVADLRAATPSNAAELAVPDAHELKRRIGNLYSEIFSFVEGMNDFYSEKLKGLLRSPILKDPTRILRTREQLLDDLIEKGSNLLGAKLDRYINRLRMVKEEFAGRIRLILKGYEGRIGSFIASLNALNPIAVLDRGYSITRGRDGRIIKSNASVEKGDKLDIILHKGGLSVTVEGKFEVKDEKKEDR